MHGAEVTALTRMIGAYADTGTEIENILPPTTRAKIATRKLLTMTGSARP